MLLQKLTHYYEQLAAKDDCSVPLLGFGTAKVSFALRLSEQGEVLAVFPLHQTVKRGKKDIEIPINMTIPESGVRSSGVRANFLCDTSSYILGIDDKGKPDRTRECFEASQELHMKLLSSVDDQAAHAVVAFYEKWNPETATENDVVKDCIDLLFKGGNMVFQVGDIFVHEAESVKNAWMEYYSSKNADSVQMRCLVTGRKAPVAVLHPKIKGIPEAQSTGAALVSFNAPAYESYGRSESQGLNAPVSEYAAFAYSTALNKLLADEKHRVHIGDMMVVYWSEDANKLCQDIFAAGVDPREDENNMLHAIMQNIASGQPLAFDKVDMSVPFYVLGLAPNAARAAVRFFLRDSFGNIITNLMKHYQRLEINKGPKEFAFMSVYWMLRETVSSKTDKQVPPPLLAGSVMRTILTDIPYPEALYTSTLNRIMCEQDDNDKHILKVTSGRAAIIKACLLKKNNLTQEEREVLTVSLNEQSTNKPYVLGRLFAVLEKAQMDANPGINSTIKNRYFTSACATPGMVFPTLLKLAQAHISKSEYGGLREKEIGDLLEKMPDGDPFPARLNLQEQGLFILGYYQQRQQRFVKKDTETNN